GLHLDADAAQNPEAVRMRDRVLEQRRLADACLAAEDEHAASTRARVLEHLVDRGGLGVTPDQRRRLGRPRRPRPPAATPGSAPPIPRRTNSVRDAIPSFANTLRRWYSTVRGLRNSCAATSLFEFPSPTRRAICSSCGVSWSIVLGSRFRAVSPVARSSAPARSAQSTAPASSNVASAGPSCSR